MNDRCFTQSELEVLVLQEDAFSERILRSLTHEMSYPGPEAHLKRTGSCSEEHILYTDDLAREELEEWESSLGLRNKFEAPLTFVPKHHPAVLIFFVYLKMAKKILRPFQIKSLLSGPQEVHLGSPTHFTIKLENTTNLHANYKNLSLYHNSLVLRHWNILQLSGLHDSDYIHNNKTEFPHHLRLSLSNQDFIPLVDDEMTLCIDIRKLWPDVIHDKKYSLCLKGFIPLISSPGFDERPMMKIGGDGPYIAVCGNEESLLPPPGQEQSVDAAFDIVGGQSREFAKWRAFLYIETNVIKFVAIK